MNKLKLCYDNVVIGSHTIEERKFQVLNFMNMLYDCIVEDHDYSWNGYSNLSPWTNNLIFEIKELERLKSHNYIDLNKIYNKIYSIGIILKSLYKEDSKSYKKIIKNHCLRIWEDVLCDLTKIYQLKYEAQF